MAFQRLILTSSLVLVLAASASAEPPAPAPLRACHAFISPDLEGEEIEGTVPGHSVIPIVRVSAVRFRGPASCRSIRRSFTTVGTIPHPVGWRCHGSVVPVAPDDEPESARGQASCERGSRWIRYRWQQVGTAISD